MYLYTSDIIECSVIQGVHVGTLSILVTACSDETAPGRPRTRWGH